MTIRIFRPTYLIDELGELGRLPDGAIVNIGGTDGPYFTVGGKALLFADGSPTAPVTGGIDLQNVYDNGTTGNINLSTGKPFTITALNNKRLIVDPATGAVTIEGDLSVLGDTVVIDKTIQNVDQLNVRMPSAGTVGIDLRPDVGVVPTANLLEVRNTYSGLPVFAIDAAGDVHVQNILIGGLANGIDLVAFYNAFTAHVAPGAGKHAAADISYSAGANVHVTGTNVQQALDSIESELASITVAANVVGFEYIQAVPAAVWTINHNSNSKRVQVTVWDDTDELVFADTVTLTSVNTTTITFNTAIAGRAVLMIF